MQILILVFPAVRQEQNSDSGLRDSLLQATEPPQNFQCEWKLPPLRVLERLSQGTRSCRTEPLVLHRQYSNARGHYSQHLDRDLSWNESENDPLALLDGVERTETTCSVFLLCTLAAATTF